MSTTGLGLACARRIAANIGIVFLFASARHTFLAYLFAPALGGLFLGLFRERLVKRQIAFWADLDVTGGLLCFLHCDDVEYSHSVKREMLVEKGEIAFFFNSFYSH